MAVQSRAAGGATVMRNFLVGVVRWSTRVSAYFYLMTDVYPPFSLEP